MSKKRRILLIDDDPSILRTLSKVLNKAGFTVEAVQTGREASEKFQSGIYDAALVDVGLGETRGTDLLPHMREVAPKMLRIVFTGTPFSEGTLDQARRDADIFLLKPVNQKFS